MRLVFSLVVLAAIGAACVVGFSWISLGAGLPDTLQDMLDKNVPGNALKVSYVKVPISAAVPYVGPAVSEGYFMFERKGGAAMLGNCAYEAIEFELREAANDQIAITISPEQLAKVWSCQ